MKLLLHTCCAPCLMGVLPLLSGIGDAVPYWFNPNIHPYTEYKSRLDALKNFAPDAVIGDCYGLRGFVRNAPENGEKRCRFCYDWRVGECARFAGGNNFGAFSTTLLASPYQDHEKLRQIGEKYAELYKIKFLYVDFRGNFRAAQKQAREAGVYMQKYCGCVFSEEERYLQPRKK